VLQNNAKKWLMLNTYFLHCLTSGLLEVMVLTKKSHCCSTRVANFFSNRVINISNSLPSHIVQSPSLATFENGYAHLNFQSALAFKLCYFSICICVF